MLIWHRLFGLILIDLFTGTPYIVEIEKDLSIQQQFLDVVILRRDGGSFTGQLPDGLDSLADHNLLTYKSLHEPMDVWALMELLGHFVNYRKQVTEEMLPLESFRLYAVSTRSPRNLRKRVKLRKIQSGVYEVVTGLQEIRLIVLSEMPNEPHNAIWQMFSANPDRAAEAVRTYRPRTNISGVIEGLWERYQLEGMRMSYTLEDWNRDYLQYKLQKLSVEERLAGIPTEEVLRHFSAEDLLRALPPEDRLRGLPPDEIESYLRRVRAEQEKAE